LENGVSQCAIKIGAFIKNFLKTLRLNWKTKKIINKCRSLEIKDALKNNALKNISLKIARLVNVDWILLVYFQRK
jgi:hypothetical protein